MWLYIYKGTIFPSKNGSSFPRHYNSPTFEIWHYNSLYWKFAITIPFLPHPCHFLHLACTCAPLQVSHSRMSSYCPWFRPPCSSASSRRPGCCRWWEKDVAGHGGGAPVAGKAEQRARLRHGGGAAARRPTRCCRRGGAVGEAQARRGRGRPGLKFTYGEPWTYYYLCLYKKNII